MNKEETLITRLVAIGDTVIVIEDTDKEKMFGSLIIPETSNASYSTGIVVGKGEDCKRKFKVGDRVKFRNGSECEDDNKHFLLLTDYDIIAVIDDKKSNPTRLKALSDVVIVIRDSNEQLSSGGIILPDTSKAPQCTGIVVSKGDGCKKKFEVGDRVKFRHYADKNLSDNGSNFLEMTDFDIIAIIPKGVLDLSLGTKKTKKPDLIRPDFKEIGK